MPVSSRSLICLGWVVAVALPGCASTLEPSSLNALARKQHALAVARAAEYCQQKGLAMRANTADAPTRPGQVEADFQFRCVKPQR